MNIKKVEKSVRKISQLVENIKEEGTVSRIEKDLLLSYVRDLYEKISETESSTEEVEKKRSREIVQPITQPSRVEEQRVSVDMSDLVRQELQQPMVTPEYISQPTTQAPRRESTVYDNTAVQVETEVATPNSAGPADILALFDQEAVSELSDKLSRSPIADLTKCMGINERIFTVNELFGGDSSLFNSAMKSLDGFKSLEQARDYLVDHVAVKHDWSNENRLKKAATFVKLISRRY